MAPQQRPIARLTGVQARRLAIAAQGLSGAGGSSKRPVASVDRRHLRRVLQHTGLFQIDSVNVLARAHYLPSYSRLGPYDVKTLDDMAFRHRELFEYWGHEAALLPVDLHPLLRWRMKRAEAGIGTWRHVAQLARDQPGYIEEVYDEVVARGPVTAGQVADDTARSTENWGWNWSPAKIALEYLFWCGRITTASRVNFERRYDIPERVLPRRVLDAPTPDDETAHRELLVRAAGHHGVGTVGDLADYFRLKNPQARPRIAELVEDGRLEPVEVDGWREPGYVLPGTLIPRKAAGAALLVPFDPLIWERDRTERLFGFRYRIEIYVPAHKREHGYYVLPFLLGDRLVARVDLKADRAASALLVQAAWVEPDAPAETAERLFAELRLLADWLALDDVVVVNRGDLALALSVLAR
ncbi:MAG TPA: crosslink repair DNA glycosylase YcaQ family protein [Mycobacteriales bacterium]|nr:crosslink repair DNA glycosylase YcaQ family protein [Mycobacteriales bacterium]